MNQPTEALPKPVAAAALSVAFPQGQAAAPPLFPDPRPARPKDPAALFATVAVDAEEDFDWTRPLHGTPHSTECMRRIDELEPLFGAVGAVPTYLLTYPLLDDMEVVRLLRRQHERGLCELGVQLHSWVTPPFEDEGRHASSFACNLPPELELRKAACLQAKFAERFGIAPRIYRSGRYGIGPALTRNLGALGVRVDVSLAPRSDFSAEGGPDLWDFDCRPFWFGGPEPILEVPLCRSVIGWGGARAAPAHRWAEAHATPLSSLLTRLGFAERITLSPEGNDLPAMIRLVRHLTGAGQRVLVVSFHSSSLAAGRNPYVRDARELRQFHARLAGILRYLAGLPKLRFVPLSALPDLLEAPSR